MTAITTPAIKQAAAFIAKAKGETIDADLCRRLPPEGDPARYVFIPVVKPTCTHCGATDSQAYKSVPGTDGTKSQYRECKTCGGCFIAVFHFLESTNNDLE